MCSHWSRTNFWLVTSWLNDSCHARDCWPLLILLGKACSVRLETEEERFLLDLSWEKGGKESPPAHQGKDKQETKWYKLSRDRGQRVIRSSSRWNSLQFQPHAMFSSFDLVFFHFYFLSLLKFMKACFISLPYLVLFFGTFLGLLIFSFPKCQSLLYCQVLTGGSWTPHNAL